MNDAVILALDVCRAVDPCGRVVSLSRDGVADEIVYNQTNGTVAAISNAEAVVTYAYTSDLLDDGGELVLAGGVRFQRRLTRISYFIRDVVGSITNSSPAATNGWRYGYDVLNRPVSRSGDTFAYNSRGEVASATVVSNAAAYAYDGIGNATTSVWNGVATSYSANALNQYAGFEYSANGELTSLGGRSFFYDAKSRLVAVGDWAFDEEMYAAGHSSQDCYRFVPAVSNRYDHLDRRVQKVTPEATHTYFYDGWMLIKEVVTNTSGTTDVIEYHWGKDLSGTIGGAGGVGGLLYLSISNSNSQLQLYVPFYDAYGNIMGYWDAQGNVVAEYTYDAFGKLIASSGPMADVLAFRYSTKYYDPETGLYYYGYRYYSPELMRWITRDPIGEDGGVNLCTFCENSPVDAFDELGLWTATSESAGQSRRVYKFEDGDMLESLAKIVGLDSKEWQNWALSEKSAVADKTTASKITNASKPGCYVSVPNVWISADLLRGGNWYWDPIVNQGGTIGRFFGTTLLTSSNYMIVKPDNAKELISALTDNKGDVWGVTVFAHGNKWGQIVMPRENHVYGETWTDTDTVVALVKQNGYKIAKAYMMQCYSAYKGITPKPDVRRVDFGAMWRSVSVKFFGYVGENVLLLDAVPSRRPRRRGGKRR